MGDVIRFSTVIKGLKCCLMYVDCLSCPYAKYGGKKCRQRLYQDSEKTLIAMRGMYEIPD